MVLFAFYMVTLSGRGKDEKYEDLKKVVISPCLEQMVGSELESKGQG